MGHNLRMNWLQRYLRNMTLKTPKSYGYKAVDAIRDHMLKVDYERFPESELVERRRCLMAAVRSNEIEDSFRIPEQVAPEDKPCLRRQISVRE